MRNHTVPIVIEKDGRSERSYDIFSRLLKDNNIFVGELSSDERCDLIVAQLVHAHSEDSKKPLYMYINSPGGLVTGGLAIYDTMQYVTNPVVTIVNGQAASMGAVLLAAGRKGLRYAMPNARIMIHQVLGGARGQESDVERQATEMKRLRKRLEDILAHHTGQSYEKVHNDCDRDYFMSAEEALEYGLIDKILRPGDTIDVRAE